MRGSHRRGINLLKIACVCKAGEKQKGMVK